MDLLSRAEPDADALLALCRENVDERMLDAIARADHGSEHRRHRAAIERLLSAPPDARLDGWVPGEVLCLARWSQPRADPDTLADRRRFGGISLFNRSERHWIRALAITLLLRARPEAGAGRDLALLIDSARDLGPRAEAATLRFVAWRLSGSPPEDEAFFWFGLVILGVRAAAPSAWLSALCERVERAEADAPWHDASSCWLLRTTHHGDSHGLWQGLATDAWHRAGARAEAAPWVSALCERVCPALVRAQAPGDTA